MGVKLCKLWPCSLFFKTGGISLWQNNKNCFKPIWTKWVKLWFSKSWFKSYQNWNMLSENQFWKYFHMRLFTILNHSSRNIADFLQPTTALQFVKKQFRHSFFFLLSTYTNSISFLSISGILIFSYSRWIISIRYHREASYILPNG